MSPLAVAWAPLGKGGIWHGAAEGYSYINVWVPLGGSLTTQFHFQLLVLATLACVLCLQPCVSKHVPGNPLCPSAWRPPSL